MIKNILFAVAFGALPLHAQFFENFESANLPDYPNNQWDLFSGTWNVSDNGVGTAQSWTSNSSVTTPPTVYQGDRSAYINRENIGAGNASEDWLVTPAVTIPPNGALTFYTRTTISGDQGTDYQILVSTTSQTDHSSFVPIAIWTENDLAATFNVYEQKAVSLNAYAAQTVYIAFVRRYFQPDDGLGGDRWLIDNIGIAEHEPIDNPYVNNIHGTIALDIDNNGCDPADYANYIRITADNGAQQYYKYTYNGVYDMNVSGANIVVTPGNYNSAIFDASPPSYTFNFAGSGASQTADFCFTPNGNVVHDVSVEIIPPSVAPRPGFDCSYLITVRNLGHLPESGSVHFTFDDTILDFVSGTAGADLAFGDISWAFTDLNPFGTRTYVVTLNLNSPEETPPGTIGQLLTSVATVNIAGDTVSDNNTASLEQIVVGSYDPNDKTVNEGATITPGQTDDFLHYVIRFQNTGTAPAEFVRITDDLSSNLDLSTLEIISWSHDVRLSMQGNRAEFLFDNINLPPDSQDEPASHGYVAYKIKPASSVGLGSSISNTAKIYFDYNFPIITNTVTTTVTALGVGEVFRDFFKLSPNPAGGAITVSLDDAVNVQSISIFNLLGQQVKTVAPAFESRRQTMDISGLDGGTYFVRLTTDKGMSTKKIIKL